jgi:flagellar hook assembly protein FlgD
VTLDWDGKTAQGAQLPDGFYGVEVNAEGADGETVAAATFATLRVQEVALGEGGSSLILANGDRVASTDVRAVR